MGLGATPTQHHPRRALRTYMCACSGGCWYAKPHWRWVLTRSGRARRATACQPATRAAHASHTRPKAKGMHAFNPQVVSPSELGGLRSEEYLTLNPQGKMPLLVEDDGTVVWESDAICRHLLEKHAATGPSLYPATLAELL